MLHQLLTPLVIVVSNGQWAAYGDPTSDRARYLMRVLQSLGGINEGVPDGLYHFNIFTVDEKTIATLTPAP